MRHIGLHLRLNSSINDAASKAIDLKTPIFQCFLINQFNRRLISAGPKAIRTFKDLCQKLHAVYVHGSYWINLAGMQQGANRALKNEINLAKKLDLNHLILHPGSAVGINDRMDRIDALTQTLNCITKDEPNIRLILENTCHGNHSVGSNIEDFYYLKQKLDHPEQISFCLDTAHAHAYGYDLVHPEEQNKFIQLIDDAIGLDQISLIHLNDADHPRGSRLDKHAAIGNGYIGTKALKMFALDPRLSSIPLILELPILPDGQEDAILQEILSWHR